MLVGSALAWWAASATWVLVERSLLGDSTASEMTNIQAVGLLAVSGGSVVSVAAAAPIIGFAGLAGVIGSRGWLRRSVGAVVTITGIVLCASAVRFLSTIAVGSPIPGGVGGSGDQNVVSVSTVWPGREDLVGAATDATDSDDQNDANDGETRDFESSDDAADTSDMSQKPGNSEKSESAGPGPDDTAPSTP